MKAMLLLILLIAFISLPPNVLSQGNLISAVKAESAETTYTENNKTFSNIGHSEQMQSVYQTETGKKMTLEGLAKSSISLGIAVILFLLIVWLGGKWFKPK